MLLEMETTKNLEKLLEDVRLELSARTPLTVNHVAKLIQLHEFEMTGEIVIIIDDVKHKAYEKGFGITMEGDLAIQVKINDQPCL